MGTNGSAHEHSQHTSSAVLISRHGVATRKMATKHPSLINVASGKQGFSGDLPVSWAGFQNWRNKLLFFILKQRCFLYSAGRGGGQGSETPGQQSGPMIQQKQPIKTRSVTVGTEAGFQRKRVSLRERRYDPSETMDPAAAA